MHKYYRRGRSDASRTADVGTSPSMGVSPKSYINLVGAFRQLGTPGRILRDKAIEDTEAEARERAETTLLLIEDVVRESTELQQCRDYGSMWAWNPMNLSRRNGAATRAREALRRLDLSLTGESVPVAMAEVVRRCPKNSLDNLAVNHLALLKQGEDFIGEYQGVPERRPNSCFSELVGSWIWRIRKDFAMTCVTVVGVCAYLIWGNPGALLAKSRQQIRRLVHKSTVARSVMRRTIRSHEY